MKPLGSCLSLSGICCLLATTASATNLVTNGSFEDPAYPDGNWSTSIPTDWTIPGGWANGFEHGNPTTAEFSPHEGNQTTRTDASDYNKLWQDVTIPGGVKADTKYELTAYILSLGTGHNGGTTAYAQAYLYDEDGPSSSNWVYNGYESADLGAGWHQMTTTLDTSLNPEFVGSASLFIELYNTWDAKIAWDDVSLIEKSYCPSEHGNAAVLNLDMGKGDEYFGTGFAPDSCQKWNKLDVVETAPGSYGLHTFADSHNNDGNGTAFYNVQITTEDFASRDYYTGVTTYDRFDLINDNWITDTNVSGKESSAFAIEGLTPGGWYDLYLISDDAYQPEGLKYNVGPDENGTIPPGPDWGTAFSVTDALGEQNGTTYGSINQYVSFKVQADNNGSVTVDWTTNGEGNGRWGYVSGLQLVERVLGDMNDDGDLTDADVAAFILALTDPGTYDATYPYVDRALAGDINRDGRFDTGDIKAFSELVAASHGAANATGVPEPGCLALAGLALACLMSLARKSDREPTA